MCNLKNEYHATYKIHNFHENLFVYIVQLFLILIKTLNINKLGTYLMGYKLSFNIQ